MTGLGGAESVFDKRIYAQDTQPNDTRDGVIWIDTSVEDRTMWVYSTDTGGFERVQQKLPVRVLEESTAFDGSDGASIEWSNTTRTDPAGGVKLHDASSLSRPSDDSTADVSGTGGLTINPNRPLSTPISATVSSQSGQASRITIERVSDGTIINQETGGPWGSGEVATISVPDALVPGTDYGIWLDDQGNGFTKGEATSTDPSAQGPDFDIVDGWLNGTYTNPVAISTLSIADQTSGDVLVKWPHPTDIKTWDLATWQRTQDNETVEIDVEDSAGNVLYPNISQNFDVSTVAESEDVYLRARIDRGSTSNDPTLDYAARRHER